MSLTTIALFTLAGRQFPVAAIGTSLLLYPSLLKPLPDTVWTLRHELLFYLAFPVLIWNRRAGLMLFGAWTLAVFVQLGLAVAGRPLGGLAAFFLSTYQLDFLLGAGVAVMATRIPPGRWLLLLGFALAGLAAWGGHELGFSRQGLLD